VKVDKILGQPVFRRLIDIPGELDLVDVFRRSEDIQAHLDDLLSKRPNAVWFQSGIRNDEVAEALAHAGIKVVQDRCLMVDHRRYANQRRYNNSQRKVLRRPRIAKRRLPMEKIVECPKG
jgi:predicted CoA-binding protein